MWDRKIGEEMVNGIPAEQRKGFGRYARERSICAHSK